MTKSRRQRAALFGHHGENGFSLIELMIAMTIGLVFTLAVTQVLSTSEGRRRTAMSSGDTSQIGAYAMYQLDKFVRSAGSGFAYSNTSNSTYGCVLDAVKNSDNILPAPTLAAPFNNVLTDIGGSFRLAPIVIIRDGGHFTVGHSDVLIVMSGSTGAGEVPSVFSQVSPDGVNLFLNNTIGFRNSATSTTGDLIMIAEQSKPCLIEQVNSTFAGSQPSSLITQLPLAGSYYAASGADIAVMGFSGTAVAMDLGNPVVTNNPPLFQLIGVQEGQGSTTQNYSLYSYDLLQINTPAQSVIADDVFELRALYYIDVAGTRPFKPTTWVEPDPAAAATTLVGGISGTTFSTKFDAATLMSGGANSADALYSIKAIRLGLILRSALQEQNTVQAAANVTLFNDLAGHAYVRTLNAAEQKYRYKTLEATIPIRNNFY